MTGASNHGRSKTLESMNLLRANAASILICCISVVALVVPLYLWWRAVRLRGRSDLVLADRVALARLDETRQLMQPEDAREFSMAIAEILRSYIDVRFKLFAAHQPADEFLHNLLIAPNGMLGNHRASLADFLRRCDLARFEHWLLSPEEMDALLASARNFVFETSQFELRAQP